ncbi:MAG: hypothetical protein K8T20_06895 [Planctomycetes bacterium]|nr:hypothetical protein [Planctomycetota bacterium]
MEAFSKFVLSLDRRWIFLVLLLVLFIPIACPLNLPGLKPSPGVTRMYDFVENMPEGSTILISFDFDPASKPELAPMGEAMLRHAFRKKLKVVAMGLWVTGVSLEKETVERIAKEANVTYGDDYVNLGWKAGSVAVITGMGEDIHNTFPTDAKGNPVGSLKIMQRVHRLKDFDLVVSLAAGTPGIDTWIAYGSDKYKFKMGGGTTAVNAPAMSPYLQANQLVGLIGAMRGAAEYEFLLDKPGDAIRGMDAISLGHYLIVGLILMGNIAYFFTRSRKGVAA